ncbi:Metallo-hydrolase/oxidoreductase [Piromyces finnis]|uniref:Metallo-hydrolase/oxidoreductase n=1 Tax=Piromyces finnis TaxID=1754191 RepID=A0A1Y1V1R7_9FUNG|nr:Metallo-hydrolase/oxidoreductase [Piromyces finnis]|eukprot:ORX44514.1 Metallo-hydrolase/oxidoreductase [Piromyces finnis]
MITSRSSNSSSSSSSYNNMDLDLKTIHDYQENEKNVAMQLTWLGHAAILLQINSFTILFDPFLSNRASPFGFIGPYRCRERGFKSFSELPQIDFVVISHNHYDHLDKTTIKEIYAERKNSKHTKIICPLGLKKWFVRLDISKEQITECDWWDDIEVSKIEDDIKVDDSNALQEALSLANKKITISAVPCQHFSGRNIFDMGKSLWNGWVVKSQDASYYFAGDTGYRSIPDNCSEEDIEKYPFCPVFQQIGIIHGPFDLASIPIGPVMPVGMMSPIHASANDSVNIHIDCKSNHSVAIHWGTVENLGIDNIEYGPSELHTELKKKNISKEQFHEIIFLKCLVCHPYINQGHWLKNTFRNS